MCPSQTRKSKTPSRVWPTSILMCAAVLALGTALLSPSHPSAAPASRATWWFTFGPATVDCPPFDLRLAFERGAIRFDEPSGPDGARPVYKLLHNPPAGPHFLAIGRDECSIMFRMERG